MFTEQRTPQTAGISGTILSSRDQEVEIMFCSIDCMKNPVKYIEYIVEVEDNKVFNSSTTELTKYSEYYSKDSSDIAIIVNFIVTIMSKYKDEFIPTTQELQSILENTGSAFLVKKEIKDDKRYKHKIHLKSIELKTI